ncbi:MAG: hypothetical protein ABIR26_09835 [Ramlibacter sp.]
MQSLYDSLYNWARSTTTSLVDLREAPRNHGETNGAAGLIYKLKHWPDLSRHHRTADVYRALSVMSHRPVNRHWILANSRLRATQVDSLLQKLVKDGAVDVVDGSKFPAIHGA